MSNMAQKQANSARTKSRTIAKPGKLTKEELQETCLKCPSICCHDLAMQITRPRKKDEIEDLKWHLHYDTVHVAIRHHRWYLVVKGRCVHLDDRNLCAIYERRPKKCRDHKPPDCEQFGCWYETLITSPEELDTYLHGRG